MVKRNEAYKLLELKPNWNSYGGNAIDPRLLEKACDWVDFVVRNADKLQFTPCSDGSVCVECHADGYDFELQFLEYDPLSEEEDFFYFERTK